MSKYITRRKRKKEITYVFERLHIILLIIPIKHRLPTNSYLRSLNIREKPYSSQRTLIIYLITNSVIAIISHLRFNCLKKNDRLTELISTTRRIEERRWTLLSSWLRRARTWNTPCIRSFFVRSSAFSWPTAFFHERYPPSRSSLDLNLFHFVSLTTRSHRGLPVPFFSLVFASCNVVLEPGGG